MSDSKKDKKNLSVRNDSEINFHKAFSPFLRNDFHSFVVRKTEKLASALYVVTGFVPQDDPLRTRLRTCALELVSASADREKARNLGYAEGFSARCLEIGTTLSLAQRAGFVSPMNSRILCDEYAELASFVSRHEEEIFGTTPLGSLGDAEPKVALLSGEKEEGSLQQKDVLKDTQEIKKTNHKRHSSRKDIIMSLLDKKDKITIKDASDAIPDCSEKTVQRELISLVEEGVLLKEGERRWSTYRKAS